MKKFAFFTILTIFLGGLAWGQQTYTWNGGTGDWADAGNWNPNTGFPVAGDTADITSGTVTLNDNQSVGTVNISAGASLSLNTYTLTAGTVNNSGTINIGSGNLTGTTTITNTGSITTTTGTISSNGIVTSTGGTITGTSLTLTGSGSFNLTNNGNSITTLTITGAGGAVQFTNSTALSIAGVSGVGNNDVTLRTNAEAITQTGAITTTGTLNVYAGGAITLVNTGNNVATLNVTGAGGPVQFTNNQALVVAGISAGTNAVTLITTNGTVTQTGAITTSALSVTAGGAITLNATGNVVQSFTASTSGAVSLTNNTVALTIPAGGISGTGVTIGNSAGITVTGNISSGAIEIVASSGNISGAGAISGSAVTLTATSGNINRTGTISGTTSVTLSASSGTVTSGALTTAALSVTAGGAITLDAVGNAVQSFTASTSGTVLLTNNTVALTITGISAPGQPVTIINSNTITVNGAISAANLTLETTNTNATPQVNNITITASPAISSKLTIISGPDTLVGGVDYCGVVTINSNVSAVDIEIRAGEITGTGTLTASNEISFSLDELNSYTGSFSSDPIIRPRHSGSDLVYYTNADPADTHFGNAVKISSTSSSSSFNFQGFANVYLAEVVDTIDRTITVNNITGFIEFYNSYTYSGTNTDHLNLTPSTRIQSYYASNTTDETVLNMGSNSIFSIAHEININRGSLSITANGITLNSITGTTGQANNLTLNSGNIITVSGACGTLAQPLGDIIIQNAANATFNGAIWAGTFNFTGTNLTLNNTLTTSGAIIVRNSGLFTTGTLGSISSNDQFRQIGVGDTSIGGNITVTSGNALIEFNSLLTLAANVIFSTPDTGGSVVLYFGETGEISNYELTLDTGSGIMGFENLSGMTLDKIKVRGTVAVNSVAEIEFDNNGWLDLDSSSTWLMGIDSKPSPSFTGFYCIGNTITFNAGAKLITSNFEFSDPANNDGSFIIAGSGVEISASGYVTINKTFDTINTSVYLHDATLTMTGAAASLQIFQTVLPDPPVYLCNLVVNGSITLASDIVLKGTLTINNVLDCNASGNYKITLLPRDAVPLAENFDNKWDQGNFGRFLYRRGTVEIGDPDDSGHTYHIIGNTTWFNLTCFETTADILFSTYPHEHTITANGKIVIKPDDDSGAGSLILLSRLDANGTLTLVPNHPSDNEPPENPPLYPNPNFWYFVLSPGATWELDLVYVQYCWSKNAIPVPIPDVDERLRVVPVPYVNLDDPSNPTWTLGEPRELGEPIIPELWSAFFAAASSQSYYNVNWFVANYFLYSFTEDSNANGRIDRIRAQAGYALNGDFSNFEVRVDGYEIDTSKGSNGYEIAADPNGDTIYIYLKEKNYNDGDNILSWSISNESLRDAATGTITLQDEEGEISPIPYKTVDTVPPRINYAFALPGHDEVFFQMSKPVDTGSIASPSGTSLEVLDDHEFLVKETTGFSLAGLAAGTEVFLLENVWDKAVYAQDRSVNPADPYSYQYPSPRYPVDWEYSDYIGIKGWYEPGNPGNNNKAFDPITGNSSDLPPIKEWFNGTDIPAQGNKMYGGTNGLTTDDSDYGRGSHRASDLLISIPPSDLGQEDRYFIWPLWARYEDPANNLDGILGWSNNYASGYGYMGESNFIDANIIWDFTGKRYLEPSDTDKIVMQSRLNSNFGSPLTLIYGFNIPDDYKAASGQGSAGLWNPYQFDDPLPTVIGSNDFINMVPRRYQNAKSSSLSSPAQYLFNYEFDNTDYTSNGTIEFYYQLDPLSNLLAGRLDVVAGTEPSSLSGTDWYRKVRPFSFGIQTITRQRSGVTILNNVINSDKRERVYLDYLLTKSGRVTIQVFTLDGTLVKILQQGNQNANTSYYRVSWDGTNNAGRSVARGMYFIRIVAPDIDEIRKVMVIK